MPAPIVLGAVLAGSALLGGLGGAAGGRSTTNRYRRYRKQSFEEIDALFADIDSMFYGGMGKKGILDFAKEEKGAAQGILQGMETAQLGEASRIFGGERQRAQDYLQQMFARNLAALAGSGLYGSSIQAGLQRQATAEGSRLQQDISGQEAGVRTGIIGQARGAQAQIEANMPLTQLMQQYQQTRIGAHTQKLALYNALMGGGPASTTATTTNSALQGLGVGISALGMFGGK